MLSEMVGSVLSQLPQHLQALAAVVFIILAPVPLSLAFTSAHVGRRPASRGEWALIAATSWLSLQTFVALGLGLLRGLAGGPVLAAEGLLLGLGVLALARCGRPLWTLASAPWTLRGTEVGVVVTIAAVGVWLLSHSLTTPVREYDSLLYHLTALAHWSRTGTLEMLGQGLVDYYPYNFELLALLFVLPFHGHFVVGLAQLIAWTLFGLAIYATATRLGARRVHALLAASLALAQPMVLRLAGDTLQADLAFAAAFMMTVYIGLGYATRQLHWSLLVLSGAWVAGTKASGFGYLCLIVLMTFIAWSGSPPWTRAKTPVESRGPPAMVVGLSVVVALTNAGFWYARNVITTGNPLGLVGVTLFGIPIFHGPVAASQLSRSSLAAVFRPSELVDWVIVLKQLAVNLGLPVVLLAVAAGALVVGRAGGAPFWRSRAAVAVLALFVSCAALYATTPFSGDDVGTYGWRVSPWMGQGLRYALPAVGALAVAAALGMTRLGGRDISLVAVGTAAGFLALPHHRLRGLLIWAVVWLWLLGRRRLPHGIRRAAIYGSIPVLIVLSLLLRNIKDQAYVDLFPVAGYIDRHVAPGERIGLLVTNRAYNFFGTRLTADVSFVPTGATDPSEWARLLHARGVRLIGVGPILEDWWLSSNELRWLDGERRFFERVHGADYRKGSVLYRLREANVAVDAPD